jgi:sugar phosphate isomerase/epimerase
MTNLLACRPGSYGRHAHLAYAHLAELGVRHVEINIPQREKIAKTLGSLRAHGISVSSTAGTLDIKNPDIARDFEQTARLTREMGARLVFVSVRADDLDRSIVYGRLRAVGDVCARHDVTVIMETHPDLITNGDTALRTMEGVHHPNIRVNWDTANIHFYNEGVDGVEEMKKVLPYISGVHLKDTNGGYRTWYFPALGEGVVRFAEVFRIMNARGFYGPWTMELEGIQGETLTEEGAKERVAASVRHLRGLGILDV